MSNRPGAPLTIERLREAMSYDKETGVLTWLISPTRKVKVGSRVGRINQRGYRVTTFDGRDYRCARLCWMLETGEMPKDMVDHKNTDPSDDRWENLRAATSQQNTWNSNAKRPASGLKGAYQRGPRSWASYIRKPDGADIYLGMFRTKEDAHAAYAAAAAKYRGEFARATSHGIFAGIQGQEAAE